MSQSRSTASSSQPTTLPSQASAAASERVIPDRTCKKRTYGQYAHMCSPSPQSRRPRASKKTKTADPLPPAAPTTRGKRAVQTTGPEPEHTPKRVKRIPVASPRQRSPATSTLPARSNPVPKHGKRTPVRAAAPLPSDPAAAAAATLRLSRAFHPTPLMRTPTEVISPSRSRTPSTPSRRPAHLTRTPTEVILSPHWPAPTTPSSFRHPAPPSPTPTEIIVHPPAPPRYVTPETIAAELRAAGIRVRDFAFEGTSPASPSKSRERTLVFDPPESQQSQPMRVLARASAVFFDERPEVDAGREKENVHGPAGCGRKGTTEPEAMGQDEASAGKGRVTRRLTRTDSRSRIFM